MRRHPHLCELNAATYLNRLSDKYDKTLSLKTIPEKEWRQFAEQGFDLIWLMGVWRRSPAAWQWALSDPGLRQVYDTALPGWRDADVEASPYAVYAYSLDPRFGQENDLAEVKAKLNSLGMRLMLDFVPNHLAMDHLWTLSHPNRFVRGGEGDAKANPGLFYTRGQQVYFAHGKDPYFPPWTDTVQVNFFSDDARQAMIQELLRIASVSDGVRCDMAMLALNSVFAWNWGKFVGSAPASQTEFWQEAIPKVRAAYPGFVFMAEVYWDMEWQLQQQGFDFTYDKRLYDRLLHSPTKDIRDHLRAEPDFQTRSVRFIENHDEPRAAAVFGRERSRAAAIVAATVPGLRFFHDGQCEGRTVRLPVQLIREPKERTDAGAADFYRQLLAYAHAAVLHEGEWRLLDVTQTEDDPWSHQGILAWSWQKNSDFRLMVVNYSAIKAKGWILMPEMLPLHSNVITFRDHLSRSMDRQVQKDLSQKRFYVEMEPWEGRLLEMV